ncbi:MAG: hypothetical protein H6942_00935 [Candidatus Accumulibacter sp.]|uniref:hypothetical protein n=1 Tax=Accumulibacter sp. TaxID=2053492 RepID=UPI001A0F0833|nr:hypothetical protein [Accumulibacter sp.]MBE2260018.1 hypothetical protein [Paracoccaceae bacterium]MCB1941587.1 hypothetical protein [Accumulibacter sp.]MCP5247099.1 hypothetical protein [Accumulibacter sp.]
MKSRALRSISRVLLASALLAACSRQVSLENYNRLQVGQSFDEVKLIIGDPARCDEMLGIRSCIWGNEQSGIKVAFMGGQVALLSAHNLK